MTTSSTIHIVGFGSQGAAWAQCLRSSGWQVKLYLSPEGLSFPRAEALGFEPRPLSSLTSETEKSIGTQWIALLCPDSAIPEIYQKYLSASAGALRLILAHGFSAYSGSLKVSKPFHQIALFAPKAIGPKILENYKNSFPHPHRLIAAFHAPPGEETELVKIATGLGFDRSSLVPATFAQETVGDLISEQGLLCGGVFTLLLWTLEEMREAGVPPSLIQEECLSELELIAGLIRDRGPAATFKSISQAAQCGTVAMKTRMEKSELRSLFREQVKTVLNGEFSKYFQSGEWSTAAQEISKKLTEWEAFLNKRAPQTNELSQVLIGTPSNQEQSL